MIRFILVQNRQGKTRLAKWFVTYEEDERSRIKNDVHKLVASRDQKYQSNFVEVRLVSLKFYLHSAGLDGCWD